MKSKQGDDKQYADYKLAKLHSISLVIRMHVQNTEAAINDRHPLNKLIIDGDHKF